MKRFLIATSAAALFVTGPVVAEPTINEADVIVELEDAENANALEYWPQIETDLEEVMAAYIAPLHSDDGYDVKVRLTEVSLSGSKILEGEGEFNHMEGWVYVREQGDPSVVDSFNIVIDAKTQSAGIADGMIVIPGMDDFYVALLNGFADKSVKLIKDL